MIGTKTGHSVGKNKDGDRDVILLQVRISDTDDIQTVQLYSPTGDDSVPIDGSDIVVLTVDNDESWKIGIAVDQLIAPDGVVGQKKIYSVDSGGNISANILFKTDGTIEINGNTDNAVRFQKLADQITILNTKYDAHTHPDPVSGNSGPPSNIPLNIDISLAKIDEVKVK